MSGNIHPNFHYDAAVNGTAIDEERVAIAKQLRFAEPGVVHSLATADVVLAWMLSKGYAKTEASGSEVTQLRRALQNVLGKLFDLQEMWNSREPKYVPIRTVNGKTEIWLERKRAWVPVLTGDGWVGTKQIHDAIRRWELEGR